MTGDALSRTGCWRASDIIGHALQDGVPWVEALQSSDFSSYGNGAVDTNWSYTGFWRQDGTAKPALTTWDDFRLRPLAASGQP
jgi:hypothetical protein